MALVHHSDLDPKEIADRTVWLAVALMGPGDTPDRVKLVPVDVTEEEANRITDAMAEFADRAAAGTEIIVPIGRGAPSPRRVTETRTTTTPAATRVRHGGDGGAGLKLHRAARDWALKQPEYAGKIQRQGRLSDDVVNDFKASPEGQAFLAGGAPSLAAVPTPAPETAPEAPAKPARRAVPPAAFAPPGDGKS